MKKESGRRWLIAALALFLLLLAGWILLALQLTTALAGPLPFAPRLLSNLRADYGPDERGRPIAVLSLSILEDAMQALGLTDEEAAAAHESMELAMSQPVPTATAMNFEGAAPFTATPTITHTPLPTETATPLPTSTRRPPTRTPVPSNTPKPTNPPATSGPTSVASPTAAGDATKPVVDASGAVFSPPPGDIWTCTITVSNIHLADNSSGINAARSGVKYDPGTGYIYLRGLTLVSGTSLDGWYSGSFMLSGFTVSFLPGSNVKVARLTASYQDLNVYVFAEDNAGNFAFDSNDVDYHVYVSCP